MTVFLCIELLLAIFDCLANPTLSRTPVVSIALP